MTSRVRSWIALGVLAFIGNAAFRPATATAAPANDEEPTVTPYGMPARRAQPTAPPAAESSPPPAQTTMTAPPANAAPPNNPAPAPGNTAPPPGYPAAPYPGYPPPGYPPPPPGYAPYPYAYPPPGYPPPQLTKVHRPRRGLVTGGAITFGVSWGIAATFSFLLSTDNNCSSNNCNGVDYLWIPVAGPLVVAANSNSDSTGVLLLWSAAQAAGVIMFIAGMVGHDVMEYRYAKNGPTLQLGPLIARDANGLGLMARW